MKTNMDTRSLGERESNYTNSSIRQMKQKSTPSKSKSSKDNGGSGLIAAGLIAGAGVGVLAGVLLAPKKGKELRKQVTDSASKLGTQANDLLNTSREKVTSWTGKGKKTTATSGNITDPNAKTASGRDIANDPATSITM